MAQRYVVAMGSNRRHPRHGLPRQVLAAAVVALEGEGLAVEAVAPVIATPPLGHTRRLYANGAALVRGDMMPDDLLAALKRIERRFGRRLGGRRWGDRVLDLDVLLWSGGAWASDGLIVPHVAFRERSFALGPAVAVAPGWRDPLTGLTLRQLHGRLIRPRLTLRPRLPIGHSRSGP